MNNIYLDNLVSFTCSLRSVCIGAYVGALNYFAEMRVQIYFYSLIWGRRCFCVPFATADINPILPILKAGLCSVSTMELSLIRLFREEFYFLALHILLFVSYVLVLLASLFPRPPHPPIWLWALWAQDMCLILESVTQSYM